MSDDSTEDKHSVRKYKFSKAVFIGVLSVTAISVVLFGLFTFKIPPFKTLGGAIWLKNGVHYIRNEQIEARSKEINKPKEAMLLEKISGSTPSCDVLDQGLCQKTSGEYFHKTLISPAIPYKAGTPDRKEITGYCTLCNDGTFSPSCAVGRGACSWHSGVASYDVAQYRIIPGTPAIEAKPAVYSFTAASYKDSPMYTTLELPSLNLVVGY